MTHPQLLSQCDSDVEDDFSETRGCPARMRGLCCQCILGTIIAVGAFYLALSRNYNCNPEALRSITPPYNGELLPTSVVLKERVYNWGIQFTKLVDVYDAVDSRHIGYFYDMNFLAFMRFGFSDASDRIWFEAKRPWWSGAHDFSTWWRRYWVYSSDHYYVQRCDDGDFGRLGGIYYIDEDINRRPWWCKSDCMKIINVSRQDDDQKAPPVPMARVHFNYTIEWYYGGFKTRQAWTMHMADPSTGASIAAARQRFGLQNVPLSWAQRFVSRWDVNVGIENPELPNWMIVFMAALDDIDEGGGHASRHDD
eukprot:TRINITY_DN25295_c0_g1_i1.p1 TRINITY_DN25295_c0_g1~~TRINITY_DN25295_c0_g1_i1.p1  ORF type:complete len:309 (+),score=44.13 TRINITY_DN25295_c0_g1_i1:124-1050(+)